MPWWAHEFSQRRPGSGADGSRVELALPAPEVGGQLRALRRDEAAEGHAEDRVRPGADRDADGTPRPAAAPVADEDRLAVGPPPPRPRGGQADPRPARRAPGRRRAVEAQDAVAQVREHDRHSAAVGDAGRADRVRPHDALVDEQADEVLEVAHLVADVVQACPAARAAGGPRRRCAARVAEAARRRRHDGVAAPREAPVGVRLPDVLTARLRAAEAVEEQDGGKRPVARGRKRDVDVDRNAVEAAHALLEARRRAEPHALARRARAAEGFGLGRRGGRRGQERERDGGERQSARGAGHGAQPTRGAGAAHPDKVRR